MINLQFSVADPQQGLHLQARPQPVSMKRQIADRLVALVSEVTALKTVSFDRVLLLGDDFNDVELPAAQFIDSSETVRHERTRARRTWNLNLEVVSKSTENGYVNQRDMWDLEYQIARKIWSKPQLDFAPVIQLTYLSNSTDMHILDPYYLLVLNFQCEYYEPLTHDCC